ncbi:hypothetical protein CAXC1_230001 [Candidatus Xenohaliotis californiensis]|uniref:Uncharacterized protein n=1 Tax=Candidatus Xenohaliotis californiensis TaxID=84677 RepID=A0ABM9N7U9_9RICK|nr:hypothetical protein CAXC1_230001 [Candidatus Xenohaliotis californiensis]
MIALSGAMQISSYFSIDYLININDLIKFGLEGVYIYLIS